MEILFDFKIIGEPTNASLSFSCPNRFTFTAQPDLPIAD